MLAVASGGGHWVELLRVIKAFDGQDISFVTVHRAYRHDVPRHRLHVVTDATRSGRVKGLAHVAVRFNSVEPAHGDATYHMNTATVQRTAPATKKKDAAKIGGAAAGGALIGAIAGGGKGALIGTAIGGGAGTDVVMSTRGDEVHLAKGSALTVKLSEPLTIRVRG